MKPVKLHPSTESCVETAAQHRFRDLSQSALRGEKTDDDTMEEIDLLRRFLETADFPRLRAESEGSIREGRKVTFHVFETDGEVRCRMTLA